MQQAVCVRRKTKIEKKTKKSRRTQNTPRNPQQPGDRDNLETACDETRPTRSPTLARLHRFRVCGNRPRTALAISKIDECHVPRWSSGYKKGVSSWGFASRETGAGSSEPGETCLPAYSGELVLRKTSVLLGPRVLGR